MYFGAVSTAVGLDHGGLGSSAGGGGQGQEDIRMNDSWRGSWKGEITSRGSLAGGLPRDIVAQQPSAQNGHDGNAMDLR